MNSTALQPPPPAVAAGKILLIGLGNDILGDDAVGLLIAREIRRRLGDSDSIQVVESAETGLALLDLMAGFEVMILVDAAQTGRAPLGHVHEWDDGDLGVLRRGSPHSLGLGEVLALGRRLDLAVPRRVKIFAVEIPESHTVAEGLTVPLQRAFPAAVERILRAARQLQNGDGPV